MKYKSCENPYDFAYPVNNPELFIGRKKELEDVKYYLNQANLVNHPINIALLGRRSAGKTSFLNIIESEAKKLNYYVIRINLDEGDSSTQLAFFYKLFDSLFTTICEEGNFGGINGKTYDVYTDIISACNIPEDKTFCPFLFPIQYSKANYNNNINVQLSDNVFKRDLLTIADEVKNPIILLFDECNVLAKSRIHLQKLRNIFMNLPKYMLVFAGTPDLFPMMDDVFSPIIRQFKKINIGAFQDQKETEDCIKVPLQQIGIDDIDTIFDSRTYKEIKEIHNLSGGYPYEIQLICHMMFKRVQQDKATKMTLDLNVLEEVRRELESSQELIKRPILVKIRNLSKDKLLALSKLSEGNTVCTFEQLWYLEYLINKEEKWKKESLERELEYFIDEGLIVKNEQDVIIFAGDDFDKIYTKYYALEHDVLIKFSEGSLEELWTRKINDFINETVGFRPINNLKLETTLNECLDKICNQNDDNDIFSENPKLYEKLYTILVRKNCKDCVGFAEINFNLNWIKFNMIYYKYSDNENNELHNLESSLLQLNSPSNSVLDTVSIKEMKLVNCSTDILRMKLINSSNKECRNSLGRKHYAEAILSYIAEEHEDAFFWAKLSFEYIEEYTKADICNNLAYLLLRGNAVKEAIDVLEKGISICSDDKIMLALLNLNLGIAKAKENNLDDSVIYLEKSSAICTELGQIGLQSILIPKIMDKDLLFEEINEIDINEAVQKNLQVIKDYIMNNN